MIAMVTISLTWANNYKTQNTAETDGMPLAMQVFVQNQRTGKIRKVKGKVMEHQSDNH